jgi:hypothetical protein
VCARCWRAIRSRLHGRRAGRDRRARPLAARRRAVGGRVAARRPLLLRGEPRAAARRPRRPARLRRPRPPPRPRLLVDRRAGGAGPAAVGRPGRALGPGPRGAWRPAADGARRAARGGARPRRAGRAPRRARPLPARRDRDVHRGGGHRPARRRRWLRVPLPGRRAGGGRAGVRPVRGRRGGVQGRDRGPVAAGRADPGRLGAPRRARAAGWARPARRRWCAGWRRWGGCRACTSTRSTTPPAPPTPGSASTRPRASPPSCSDG